MKIDSVFAVVCVADLERSVEWYSRLFGRKPDDRPMEGLAQWRNHGGSGLQLVADRDRAGRGMVTIVTPSIGRARAGLSDANLQLGEDIQGDFGALAQISDLDGNQVTLAEPPEGMSLESLG